MHTSLKLNEDGGFFRRYAVAHQRTQNQKISEEEAVKEDSRRKRRKRSKGSQTSEENESARVLVKIVQVWHTQSLQWGRNLTRLYHAFKKFESLKQKQSDLEIKNKELEESLDFANSKIASLEKKVTDQDKAIGELKGGVKALTRQAEAEKQRAIKLESHSRRNNLNFLNIPEQEDETATKSESILRNFMEVRLNLNQEDANDISFERVHQVGKPNASEGKPRPLIAKFTFHRDKEFVLSKAKSLRGTDFAIARDFPKEIVDKRRRLVPFLKDAKENGQVAKLLYNKIYINGQRFKPQTVSTSKQ